MRLIPVLLMTGLAGALAACAARPRPLRGPVPLEWRTLVGCYRPTQGPMEWTFALDSTASAREEGARAARSLMPAWVEQPRAEWLVTDRNTVVYVLHQGWGQMMEFVVRGDSLVGTHRLFNDLIGWEPWSVPAAAVRVSCPAGDSATAP
jgi:hypothetical protein